ncbi:MAG: TRAP transporter small permease [Burkholderiales bacterium]|nr:TRAP transporter small permease [Burkholderiales bacterium]
MKQLDVWLNRLLGASGALVLMVLMLLTAVDVVGRKLDVPIRGGVEMAEILLAMLIFAGLPLVSEARQHIVIDTLEGFMSTAVRRTLDALANAICAVTMFGMAWMFYAKRVVRVAEAGDTTSVLKIELTPVAWFLLVMIVVTGLVHVALMFVPPGEEDGGTAV